jgi:hypothetical protein
MLTPALSALRESLADQAERTEEQQHLLSELELLDAVFTVEPPAAPEAGKDRSSSPQFLQDELEPLKVQADFSLLPPAGVRTILAKGLPKGMSFIVGGKGGRCPCCGRK